MAPSSGTAPPVDANHITARIPAVVSLLFVARPTDRDTPRCLSSRSTRNSIDPSETRGKAITPCPVLPVRSSARRSLRPERMRRCPSTGCSAPSAKPTPTALLPLLLVRRTICRPRTLISRRTSRAMMRFTYSVQAHLADLSLLMIVSCYLHRSCDEGVEIRPSRQRCCSLRGTGATTDEARCTGDEATPGRTGASTGEHA